DDVVERCDEDLAVTDLPCSRAFYDRIDDGNHVLVTRDDGELHLREEIDRVLGASVELGVAFLPAEAPNFGHCDALHADACESFLHVVEPVRLDDGLNAFHARLQRESKCHAPRRTSAPGQTGKKRTSWLISPNAGRLRLIDLAFCNVTAAPASLPGLEH